MERDVWNGFVVVDTSAGVVRSGYSGGAKLQEREILQKGSSSWDYVGVYRGNAVVDARRAPAHQQSRQPLCGPSGKISREL